MNESEDQIKSSGSTENSDTSHCIHVSYGRTSPSEISTQSAVDVYAGSAKEGAEPLNCNVDISVTQNKDVFAGVGEVVKEANSTITYQTRKRLKTTHPYDLPANDLEITEEDTGSPPRIGTTFSHEPVELESDKMVAAEDMMSLYAVGTNKLLENDLDCALDFNGTPSNNDAKVLIEKSNENSMLLKNGSGNGIELTSVTNEMGNDEFPRLVSGDAYCSDVPLNKNDKGSCSPVPCDADIPANNLVEEVHDEAIRTVSNVEVQNAELEDEKNISNLSRVPSADALGRDTPLHYADISLKQLDSIEGDIPLVVNECVNLAVDRTFAGYTEKKLLVLDVNGLLVDISPYVPYDYDPDDIIMRKAVFKRPYCDDFLKFCFERFNVGVWTSRTRRNMEPILDFLLGNEKCKFVFCWDQSHCTNTGFTTIEKRHKPLLLKKLKKLWEKCEPDLPWEMGVYNESNTLLLDDTPSKALSNPRYNAVFPYTYRFRNLRDNSLGPGGDLRVYLEGLARAGNVQEYVKQNPFGQRPITEKNLSWGFYLKVIEASSTPPRQIEDDDS